MLVFDDLIGLFDRRVLYFILRGNVNSIPGFAPGIGAFHFDDSPDYCLEAEEATAPAASDFLQGNPALLIDLEGELASFLVGFWYSFYFGVGHLHAAIALAIAVPTLLIFEARFMSMCSTMHWESSRTSFSQD